MSGTSRALRLVRATPWPLLLAVGTALVVVAIGSVHAAPAAPPPPVPPPDPISCAAVRDLVQGARRVGDTTRAVVRADHELVLDIHCNHPGRLLCDGFDIRLRTAPMCTTDGSPLRFPDGPHITVLRYHAPTANASSAELSMEELCIGCTEYRPRPPGDLRRAFAGIASAAGALGLALILMATIQRGSRVRRATDLLGEAPVEHERFGTPLLAPLTVTDVGGDETPRRLDGPRIGAAGPGRGVDALRAVDEEHMPRLELGGADFRESAGQVPHVIGPARVNGLPVASAARSPLDHGDVVELGTATFRVGAADAATSLVRYHLQAGSRVFQHVVRRKSGNLLGVAAWVVGVAAVGLLQATGPDAVPAVACVLAVWWLLAVLGLPRIVLRRHFTHPPFARGTTCVANDDGSYRVEGAGQTIEACAAPRTLAERALARALREEAYHMLQTGGNAETPSRSGSPAPSLDDAF